MIHTFDVLYLHDDAPGRLCSVCYLDVFRYTNGGTIAFITEIEGKATPVYISANLVELVSYSYIPLDLLALNTTQYLAQVEISLTDGRVFVLRVRPEGGTSTASPLLPFCSCSGETPTTDTTIVAYLKEDGNAQTTVDGGPPSFQLTLPAAPAAGVWRIALNIAWEVRAPGGVGFLPGDRGDNIAVLGNPVAGLLAGNQVMMSLDGSIGETINESVSTLDGNVTLYSDFPVAAGVALLVTVLYRRQNYIDTNGDDLSLTIGAFATANGPAGDKYFGTAVFKPNPNGTVVVPV